LTRCCPPSPQEAPLTLVLIEPTDFPEKLDAIVEIDSTLSLLFTLFSDGLRGGKLGAGTAPEFVLGGSRGGRADCSAAFIGKFPMLLAPVVALLCSGGLFVVWLRTSTPGRFVGGGGGGRDFFAATCS
jgi:hypothetical protein